MKVNLLLFFILSLSLFSSCNLEPYSKGKEAYEFYCASCHMKDGSGLAALIPPIAQSDYYVLNQDKIACIIINGLQDTIVVNNAVIIRRLIIFFILISFLLFSCFQAYVTF